jgi:hypothetical protein
MPWPYMPTQCPTCRYFLAFDPPVEDDSGYELPGACQHASIGMELFVSQGRPEFARMTCDLRWPAPPRTDTKGSQDDR